jgi:hypothetical protein
MSWEPPVTSSPVPSPSTKPALRSTLGTIRAEGILAAFSPLLRRRAAALGLHRRISSPALGSIAPQVVPLPDGSFIVGYDKRTPTGDFGNIAARRYHADTGWSAETKLAAGGSPKWAHDSFGNIVVIGGGGTPVLTNSFADDTWESAPDLALPGVNNSLSSVALAGDGTVFAMSYQSDFDNDIYRLAVRRLVAGEWSAEVEPKSASDNVSAFAIAADDCGNAHLMWNQVAGTATSVVARRFTPVGGWRAGIAVASPLATASRFANNPRGEAVYAFGAGVAGSDVREPQVIRFR